MAEHLQPIIVDPEVMRDLVNDGDLDLVNDLLVRFTNRQDRFPEDQNVVGRPGVELATFGEWNT